MNSDEIINDEIMNGNDGTHIVQKSRKRKAFLREVEIIVIIGIVILFILINNLINKSNTKNSFFSKGYSKYNYNIEAVFVNDGQLVIEGWCYKNGTDTPSLDSYDAKGFSVILFDDNTDYLSVQDIYSNSIIAKTERAYREDVQDLYGEPEGVNIAYSGFNSKCNYSDNLKDYLILIRYDEEANEFLDTGLYVKDKIDLNK